MFITKAKHQTVVAHLQQECDAQAVRYAYQQMMEQQLRNNLYSQIEDLRKLVFPDKQPIISREAREADAVLSASEKSPDISDKQMTEILEGQREMDLLISGNYDSDLLNV